MDKNQKFWLAFWLGAAVTLIVITISSLFYSMTKNELIAKAISDGADPIAVNIALGGETTTAKLVLITKGTVNHD